MMYMPTSMFLLQHQEHHHQHHQQYDHRVLIEKKKQKYVKQQEEGGAVGKEEYHLGRIGYSFSNNSIPKSNSRMDGKSQEGEETRRGRSSSNNNEGQQQRQQGQHWSTRPQQQQRQQTSSYDAAVVVASMPSSTTTATAAIDPEMLFPNKLFIMLHDAYTNGFSHIVSWGQDSHHGFKVHLKRDFETHVLPKYFKMTKYKSFTRQLHNYNFIWIRNGQDKGGYYHPLLDRHNVESCNDITRKDMISSGGTAERGESTTGGKKRSRSDESISNDADNILDRKPRAVMKSSTGGLYHHQEDPLSISAAAAASAYSASRLSMGNDLDQQTSIGHYWQQQQQQQQQLQQQQHFLHQQQQQQQQQIGLDNTAFYPHEQKLSPPSYTALSRSPYPHPLESYLEPRTIEEMIQQPDAGSGREEDTDDKQSNLGSRRRKHKSKNDDVSDSYNANNIMKKHF